MSGWVTDHRTPPLPLAPIRAAALRQVLAAVLQPAQDQVQVQAMAARVDVHRQADRPAAVQAQAMAHRAAAHRPHRLVVAPQQLQQQQQIPSTRVRVRMRTTTHRDSCVRTTMATGVDLRLVRAMATRAMARTQLSLAAGTVLDLQEATGEDPRLTKAWVPMTTRCGA